MSDALRCDNCGTYLDLDKRGEDENGEVAAWLKVSDHNREAEWDACTRSCAIELLGDAGPVRPVIDAHAEVIAEIARTIREARDDD